METFESFEALYQKAIFFGEIEPVKGEHPKEVKAALNSINQTFFEQAFWIWLQNKKAFNPEKGSIQPFLTEENWIEFYREHKKEAETAHADYLKKQADRKRKIDAEEPLSEKQVPQMPQVQPTESQKGKYFAKHYALAYFFEINALGETVPSGKKKVLEGIGQKRMGNGRGNTFYKAFNTITQKDLNAEAELLKIGGQNWRKVVIELSCNPEVVDKYLKNKQL
jgi:hypothetical protein